ncbi:MAG: acetoacetate decarboxylase family protein [Actinomycetota bacterium]|nr:acetoacetate decarboxylase family protein [Actinomycetota bacterium]
MAGAEFPPAPWSVRGQMHLSLWRVGRRVVGTAFVDYQPGSDLTYAELLRARPARVGLRPAATVTDIWVDSAASCAGGRALWAIPKEMATFSLEPGTPDGAEPFYGVAHDGNKALLARAEFTGGRALLRRRTFSSCTRQQRDDGEVVVAGLSGSATVRRARARWELPDHGPFADLRGRRPLASVVLEDFELRFG